MANTRAFPPPSCPAGPGRSSQQCKMAAPATAPHPPCSKSSRASAPPSPAAARTGHLLPPVPCAHQPGPPREGAGYGRGDAHGQHLGSSSEVPLQPQPRTDWDKMAERRGRSRQPAHLTRKYRPSLSPPGSKSAFREVGVVTFFRYYFLDVNFKMNG